MAFSEKIKNKVKEKADFKCCRCKHISFEVHHIIPQCLGGEDSLSNAAPLCPNCHTDFGANPEKRKEITQMRDIWYKRVEWMYARNPTANNLVLSEINCKLEAISAKQDSALVDLKEDLKEMVINKIEQMTVGTAKLTATNIANASLSPYTQEQIDAEGDSWVQQQLDLERGK